MEDIIKNIIDRAKTRRTNSKITDYDIAQFVHIELGKVMYYDNNYSAKFGNGKDETKLSNIRKSNMLRADTDKSQKAQICKGMAEIYAEILNEVGIEARAIGIEKKGETQEVGEDEAKHYCAVFKIKEQEYVQDYLMESALMRIKIGEAEMTENIPGMCPIEEYKERGPRSLMQTDLSHQYLDKIFGENMIDLNDGQRFDFIFEKLNQYFRDTETEFGFEEAKDFVFLAGKNFIRTKPKIINLVRENESECGVVCIYEIDGKKYLVRGGYESTDIEFTAGKISNIDFAEILNQGYEGRSQEERNYIAQDRKSYNLEFMTLDEFCQVYKKEIDEDIKKQEIKSSKDISMKDVVKNAISNGIATEQVAQIDREQNTLSNEKNIEEVTKDE